MTVGGDKMWFSIDFNSHIPVYKQIMNRIKEKIILGEIKKGEFIPSIRALAKMLGVNLNTVARAYRELEREGVIESIRGEGFVALFVDKEKVIKEIKDNLKLWLEKAKLVDIKEDEIKKIFKEVYENDKDN